MKTLCPRCEKNYYTPYGEDRGPNDPAPPALSRVDNQTRICSDCGTLEALMDMTGEALQTPDHWPVTNNA